MEKVLVAGANGKTGREIISILKDHSKYEPVAMIRKEEQKENFESKGVKTVLADLEKDVSHAVKGKDKVIFAAGSGSSTSDKKTVEVDEKGAISLINESEKEGVSKFVMLSSMGTDNPKEHSSIEQFLISKKKADDHLKNSQQNFSIVKPGMLTDEEKTNSIKAKHRLNESGKISRKDVAQILVQCLSNDIANNREFEILSGEQEVGLALTNIEKEG